MPKRHSRWISPVVRIRIYSRDGWRCYLCGRRLKMLHKANPFMVTLDHVISRVQWLEKYGTLKGVNVHENLRTACRPCNSRKGSH